MPRGERMFRSIFKYLKRFSSSSLLLVFVFRCSESGGSPCLVRARLFCMLALYGTYRVRNKDLKFAGAEAAYCDKRCFTAGLRIFLV